ncbi:hypothetical protein ACOSQ4_022607 [Xanthoceras sorbifolium]
MVFVLCFIEELTYLFGCWTVLHLWCFRGIIRLMKIVVSKKALNSVSNFGDFSVIVVGITGTGRIDFAKIHCCCIPSLKHRDPLYIYKWKTVLNGQFELFIYVSSGEGSQNCKLFTCIRYNQD